MTTDPNAYIEVLARLLCAADVHVHDGDHPTWQQLRVAEHGRGQDNYRKAASWLQPKLTIAAETRLSRAERRCDELRAESKRRGRTVLEQSGKIRALEREVDGLQAQLGAEILQAAPAAPEAAPPTGQADEAEVVPPPALTEVGRLRAQVEVLEQDAERDRGLAKVGARCMRDGHQGLIEHGRAVIEGWRFALSTALGLGTGAPWDAIRERAAELAGQPVGGDRGVVLREAAEALDGLTQQPDMTMPEGRWRAGLDAGIRELRRLADEERDEREAQAHLDQIAEDICRPVDIGGEIMRVHGVAEMSAEGRAALAEVTEIVKRRMAEDATPVAPSAATPNGTGGGVAASGDRAALIRAAEIAEDVAEGLRKHHEFERSTGALDVMTELRRLAAETPGPETQAEAEAHPAEHTWAAELRDPLTDEWVPSTRYLIRDRAVNHLTHARSIGPTWKDGTPTERRLVRATTTYKVEDEAPRETVHGCPPDGSGLTPCCGRTPFELPLGDRISSEPDAVTCPAPAVTLPGKEA